MASASTSPISALIPLQVARLSLVQIMFSPSIKFTFRPSSFKSVFIPLRVHFYVAFERTVLLTDTQSLEDNSIHGKNLLLAIL